MHRIPVTLTIAGSDPSGGAGLQADIKAMSALGCFAASAVTAITVQNTLGVTRVEPLDAALVRAQIDAVAGDLDVAATKVGMLASVEVVEVVADAARAHAMVPLIVDPVLAASAGGALLADDAVDIFVRRLLPLATLLTPNAPEASRLTGIDVVDLNSARRAVEALVAMGARAVLLKGGHLPRQLDDDGSAVCVDLLWDGERLNELRGAHVDTPHTHGTGCMLASAIAANLARGHGLTGAVRLARRYVHGALAYSLAIGRGVGPTDPFFFLEPGEAAWQRASAVADD